MKYNYTPSCSEIRHSFKFRSKEYLLENTLTGVPYIVDSTRPKWERIIWFILIMASVAATIATIVTIWDKFQTSPTRTVLDTLTDDIQINFPQIFLCLNWPDLNHTILDQSEQEIYEQLYNWEWGTPINISYLNSISEAKNGFYTIFKQLIPDCGVLFKNCMFSGIEEPCENNLIKMITPAGACCKFNATKPITIADSPWEFTFISTFYPFRLYLLDKLDFAPNRDDRPVETVEFPIEVKFTVDITYATEDLQYLTFHQRQCHYDSESLSLNNCELKCIADNIYEQFNCLPWFFPRRRKSQKKECLLSQYQYIKKNYTKIDRCMCTSSCDQSVYNCKRIRRSVSDDKGKPDAVANKIEMQSWPQAQYKRETQFGYLDLLVSFGGIAGLFLGYSLLTSVEFGYYMSLRTYCGAVVDSSRKKHNIVTIHVVDAKYPKVSKIDTTPKYFDYID